MGNASKVSTALLPLLLLGAGANAAPPPRLAVTLDGRGSLAPAPSLAPWLDGLAVGGAQLQAPPSLSPLRGLEQLEHITVPLGRAHLRVPGMALRIDGDLHLVGAWPALGARVAFDVGRTRVKFEIPSVQVIPREQAGGRFMELKLVLFERRF